MPSIFCLPATLACDCTCAGCSLKGCPQDAMLVLVVRLLCIQPECPNHCLQEVRRKLFAQVRHCVASKLLLAKPTFCQHLIEINHFVSEISQVKMSYCNSSHLYQLEEYSDLQVVTREQKAKPVLESTSEKVQQVSMPLLLNIWMVSKEAQLPSHRQCCTCPFARQLCMCPCHC